jgi:hypothetical protein
VGAYRVPQQRQRLALANRWHQNDKQREEIRNGKLSEDDAVDIMFWFCEDMHNTDTVPMQPDAVEQLIRKKLSECDNSRFPWMERIMRSKQNNLDVVEKRKQDALDYTHDVATDKYYHSSRASRVFQSGGNNG